MEENFNLFMLIQISKFIKFELQKLVYLNNIKEYKFICFLSEKSGENGNMKLLIGKI